MKTNYVLVDFENVQPNGLKVPEDIPFRVYIFVGGAQTKIPMELAISLQNLGGNVKYVKAEGTGKNVLDFHIAYWLGRLSKEDPDSYFHIISKDKGFDVLVKHLRKNKVLVQRVNQIVDIPLLNGEKMKSVGERIEHIRASLISRGNSKPRKRSTLKNTVSSMFMKALSEEDLENLIKELERRRLIHFDGDAVTYSLDSQNKPLGVT